MTYTEILAKHSLPPPSTQLIWTAIVDVADRQDLGPSPAGHRYIVPILGGRFYGGPDIEGLNGMILAGGADRQLLRPDGIKCQRRTKTAPVAGVKVRQLAGSSRSKTAPLCWM